MECKITSTERRGRGGFTLVEMMVSASLGLLIVGGLVAVQLYGNFSFASLYNYTSLSNQSHVALDKMTLKIRQTSSLTSFTSNSISFTNSVAGNTLTYTYSPNSKTLTEIYAGATNVLLTGCNSLTFAMYQRNPISNSWDQVVATNAAQCKLLQVEWNCSRSLYASQTNESEVMESSKIVIRN
jgi:hypothetical protein